MDNRDRPLAPGPALAPPPSARAALRFCFETPGAARKIAVASLLELVPVVGWIVVQGWVTEGAQRLARHHPDPLPAIGARDLPRYFRQGLAPWGTLYLGAAATAVAAYAVFVAFNLIGLAAALAAGAIAPLALWVAAGFVTLGALLAVATIYNAGATTRAALGERFADALAPAGAWRFSRGQRGRLLVAYGALSVAIAAICAAGAALCGVGLLPALVVAQISAMHLGVQHAARRPLLAGRAAPKELSA